MFLSQQTDYPNYDLICGVDEAGRGPLAGPLVVAAVILKKEAYNAILDDSKKISEKKRLELYHWIVKNAIDYKIEIISVEDIDQMNILAATLQGMKLCVEGLQQRPEIALIDGNMIPKDLNVHAKAIVKGDTKYASIAAASVLAKVTRDKIMCEIGTLYPEYSFSKHKGYHTSAHINEIKKYGITPHHRKSFKPIKEMS